MKQIYDYITLFVLTGLLSATIAYQRIKSTPNNFKKKINGKRKNSNKRAA